MYDLLEYSDNYPMTSGNLWDYYRDKVNNDTNKNNGNGLFDLSFKKVDNDPSRDSSNTNYMSLVEVKDFNALLDNKPFFDQPVKNKQGAYEKLVEMSKNDDYATGNLLHYLYHQNYYKPIGIALSGQLNTTTLQQINFTGKRRRW